MSVIRFENEDGSCAIAPFDDGSVWEDKTAERLFKKASELYLAQKYDSALEVIEKLQMKSSAGSVNFLKALIYSARQDFEGVKNILENLKDNGGLEGEETISRIIDALFKFRDKVFQEGEDIVAEKYSNIAYSYFKKYLNLKSARTVDELITFADECDDRRKFNKSEAVYLEILRRLKYHTNVDHVGFSYILKRLAGVYTKQGRHKLAEVILSQC